MIKNPKSEFSVRASYHPESGLTASCAGWCGPGLSGCCLEDTRFQWNDSWGLERAARGRMLSVTYVLGYERFYEITSQQCHTSNLLILIYSVKFWKPNIHSDESSTAESFYNVAALSPELISSEIFCTHTCLCKLRLLNWLYSRWTSPRLRNLVKELQLSPQKAKPMVCKSVTFNMKQKLEQSLSKRPKMEQKKKRVDQCDFPCYLFLSKVTSWIHGGH